MISFHEALTLCLQAVPGWSLEKEASALLSSAGRVVAHDIYAPLSIQPFDNSAMDGYALDYEDLRNASEQSPVQLKIADIIAAGDKGMAKEIVHGTCMKIMTGAPLPEGANAVIPYERAEVAGDIVVFKSACQKGDNVRFTGEDFRKDDIVLKKGTLLESHHVLPLATLGIGEIEAYRKPTAFFMATGRELVDELGTPLREGQIYNSNKPYALTMLESMGMNVLGAKTIPDEPEMFQNCLLQNMQLSPDFIISSGAVSAGDYDFVRKELEKIGAEILFHKVKMKPGKPNLLAKLPNGSLYFGLPGNPIATAVGLRFFVAPTMRRLLDLPDEAPVKARALNDFKKRPGLQVFLKARRTYLEDGTIGIEFLKGQESFMVSPFLHMNAWAIIPEEAEFIKAGELIDTYAV